MPRIREVDAVDDPQLHPTLAEDQRADHVSVGGAVPVADHAVLAIDHFGGAWKQLEDPLPSGMGGPLHARRVGIQESLEFSCRGRGAWHGVHLPRPARRSSILAPSRNRSSAFTHALTLTTTVPGSNEDPSRPGDNMPSAMPPPHPRAPACSACCSISFSTTSGSASVVTSPMPSYSP